MEEPPLLESENVNPDIESTCFDSVNEKNGYMTPNNSDKTRQNKERPPQFLDPNSENVLNPILNASASSQNSKDVSSPSTIPYMNAEILVQPEIESEPLPSARPHPNFD